MLKKVDDMLKLIRHLFRKIEIILWTDNMRQNSIEDFIPKDWAALFYYILKVFAESVLTPEL